jgi:hypothetical protein
MGSVRTARPIPSDQVDDGVGDDSGGVDDLVSGGVERDGETGAQRSGVGVCGGGVGDGDAQGW